MKHKTADLTGALPEPAYPALREGDLQTAPWEVDCYTADQMRSYAAAAVAAAFANPVAWQCREHGDDEWNPCSREGFNANPGRYVYRALYAAKLGDEVELP